MITAITALGVAPRMGALRRTMKWTTVTFSIGWLAIAGIPPLAGFWSKGDVLDNTHTMCGFSCGGSDGVFVASPGMHNFINQALSGFAGNRWFVKPPDVIGGPDNSWYLSDTRSIARLPGDSAPSPTPKAPNYVVPPDPGTGPVLATPSPSPIPSCDPSGC